MPTYTNQTKVQGFLKRKFTDDEAVLLTMLLDAVDKYIDRETGVTWHSDSGSASRLYAGGGMNVWVDPVSSITAVEWINRYGDVVFSYEEGTHYQAWPLNQATKTYLTKINYIDELDSQGDSDYIGRWPSTGQGIRVTGNFGEAGGVPNDISWAATILAAEWLQAPITGRIRLELIEGYRREFWEPQVQNPQVAAILASRRRILL